MVYTSAKVRRYRDYLLQEIWPLRIAARTRCAPMEPQQRLPHPTAGYHVFAGALRLVLL